MKTEEDASLDLKTLKVELFDTLEVGEQVPGFVVTAFDESNVCWRDYHTKLVVLGFWSALQPDSLARMRGLRAIHQEFGDNPRFRMLTVACDHDAEVSRRFVESNSAVWDQGHIQGLYSRVANDLAVRNLPTTYLVGSGGTVLAKNLS